MNLKQKKDLKLIGKKTELEALKIIYEGFKIKAQDTINDHNEISKKFFSILILLLSISSALIAFLFNHNFKIKIIAFVTLLLCGVLVLSYYK